MKISIFYSQMKMTAKKLNFLRKTPKEVYVAFSGGIDSMVLLHSLIMKGDDVKILFVNHGNTYAQQEYKFAKHIANLYGLEVCEYAIPDFDETNSLEAFWSRKRFEIFQSQDRPVLTGHHLDDVVEWYVMTSMQGCSKLMDYRSGNILRPLLTTKKEDIIKYANYHGLAYLTDPSNSDTSYNLRNKVRHELIGSVKNCFPGIQTTVKKLIVKKTNSEESL